MLKTEKNFNCMQLPLAVQQQKKKLIHSELSHAESSIIAHTCNQILL